MIDQEIGRNPNNLKKRETTNFLGEICSISLFSLIFAILFGIFTSEISYYEGDECVNLLKWGHIMFYFCFTTFICYGLVAPLLYFTIFCWKNESFKSFSSFSLYSIRVGLGLLCLIFFIALCVAYTQNEACGDLRKLVLAYIILIGISLGLIVTVACLCCCVSLMVGEASGSLAEKMQFPDNKGYSSVNS